MSVMAKDVVQETQRDDSPPSRHYQVAIVGAGLTGLGLAIELRRAAVTDFVLLERAAEVGGVWRDNRYPGICVDVPSTLYYLRRAPHAGWSRVFAPGAELHSYARRVADDFGLRRHIRFGAELVEARWDEAQAHWVLRTTAGDLTATMLVTAAGQVADPSVPDLPGLADFPGTVFHSARWDADHDFTGRRVAVIGTGASAIQFVPQLAKTAGEVHVVQRTPPWIVPRADAPVDGRAQAALRRVPGLIQLRRARTYLRYELVASARTSRRVRGLLQKVAHRHLQQEITDPVLLAKLTPDYEVGCKRALISSDYYPAMRSPNVHLHTGGLVEVKGSTIVAGDGSTAEVDTIVLNTGFEIGRTTPIARRIIGRDGHTLQEHWAGRPHAYLGMASPGFPNFFQMLGPNSVTGASSVLVFSDAQSRYITDAVRTIARKSLRTVEVRAEVERRYTAWIRRRSAATVWEVGGCQSYYQDDHGENVVLFPGFSPEYQLRTRRFDSRAYHVSTEAAARSGARSPVVA